MEHADDQVALCSLGDQAPHVSRYRHFARCQLSFSSWRGAIGRDLGQFMETVSLAVFSASFSLCLYCCCLQPLPPRRIGGRIFSKRRTKCVHWFKGHMERQFGSSIKEPSSRWCEEMLQVGAPRVGLCVSGFFSRSSFWYRRSSSLGPPPWQQAFWFFKECSSSSVTGRTCPRGHFHIRPATST